MPYTSEQIGYQNTDTSKAAAESGAGKKITLRDQVLAVIEDRSPNLPVSVETVSAILNRPTVSVRPRFTELKNAGKIEDSGERGRTQFGKACILWKATT